MKGMTAGGRIVEHIRAELLAGRLEPGEPLGTESEFAQRFGVSRSVARDALKGLEAIGVVEIRTGARGGVMIARGNPDHYADALAIQLRLVRITNVELIAAQLAIEGMAAELAAYYATEEDLARLEHLNDQAERSLDELDRFRDLSFAFHLAMIDASKNRVLAALIKSLEHVRDEAYGTFPSADRARLVLKEHRLLVAALRRRDGTEMRNLMNAHLERVRSKIMRR
jgi:GntR family transcriptional repressor for pyruvate dehydrogenase complex